MPTLTLVEYVVYLFVGAVIYISLVLIAAHFMKWGHVSYENGVLKIPGGALSLAFPLAEALLACLMLYVNNRDSHNATAELVTLVICFVLVVRLLLFVVSWLTVLELKVFSGLRKIECIDERVTRYGLTKSLPEDTIAIHDQVCAAYVLLTICGFMPGLVLVAILMGFGVQVPLWVVVLSMAPVFLLFAKLSHVIPAVIPDMLEKFTEWPALYLSKLLLGYGLEIQHIPPHS